MWHTLFLISFTLSNIQNYPLTMIPNSASSSNPIKLVTKRSQQISGTSKIATTSRFEIIEDISKSNIKRSVTVRLKSKVSKKTLSQIARKIKKSDRNVYQRTFILYYLPEMEIGAGAWTTTHFNPTLKANIWGLSLEEEKALKNKTKTTSRKEYASKRKMKSEENILL